MSDMQPKAPEQLTVNEQGDWQYPSGLAEGYEKIEVPSLPGAVTSTESLHLRDFGGHVVGKLKAP